MAFLCHLGMCIDALDLELCSLALKVELGFICDKAALLIAFQVGGWPVGTDPRHLKGSVELLRCLGGKDRGL